MLKRSVREIRLRATLAVEEFIHNEVAGSVLLFAASVSAVVWANSPWANIYFAIWKKSIGFSAGRFIFSLDLHHWIDDGLMALFFFVVGLEIKREIFRGELSSFRKAALPVAAAIGGVILPAAIYAGLNRSGEASRGWGIPMATDIGFAMGVLALLGKRIPSGLRVFMLALAIVDDLCAILVIALFYTEHISIEKLGIALAIVILLWVLLLKNHCKTWAFVILGTAFWAAILKSGIHATLAGVVLGLLAPIEGRFDTAFFTGTMERLQDEFAAGLRAKDMAAMGATLARYKELIRGTESMAVRFERSMHPWVVFLVLPLFALANAGVRLSSGQFRAAIESHVGLGILLGLIVGKFFGIMLVSLLAVKSGLAAMVEGVNWPLMAGASALAGIGFTVSLFIAGLAFESDELISNAKVDIFVASLISGIIGYLALRLASRAPEAQDAISAPFDQA